jgi:hypothetical protein
VTAVAKDSAVVVVAPGKPLQAFGELTSTVAKSRPTSPTTDSAIQAATLKLLDALERRALKGSRRNNGIKPAVLEDEDESDALPSGMPTLLISETGWGGRDTDLVEDRLYMVVNTAADTLITQMSGQQFDGICLALAGGLFCTDVGELMISGKEDAVSDIVSHLTDVLEQAVRFLSQHFAEVFIPCVSATGWGSATTAPDDLATLLDRLAYQMLRARLADLIESGRVAIEISPTSSLPYAIYGTTYRLVACGEAIAHKHGISSPRVMPRNDMTGVGYDYVVTGNRHALDEDAGFIANGAFNGGRPQQALWVTHPAMGISTVFAIPAEPASAEAGMPAYRVLKPAAMEIHHRYG